MAPHRKERYNQLLREIPRFDCGIKALHDKGQNPSDLDKLLETKKRN